MMGFGGRGFGMHGFAGGLAGGVFMLVFWIAVILLIAVVIRWLIASSGTTAAPNVGSAPGTESALDLLRSRYARGEIDTQEFEERKKALNS